MLNVSSEAFKPDEVKVSLCSEGSVVVFLSRAKSKGQCPDMGFGQCKAQKGRGVLRAR